MARRGRKYVALKYGAVAVIAAAVTAFFFLHRDIENTLVPALTQTPALTAGKPQPAGPGTGYKAEDREKLEKLIHNGGKDD